jgi:hypothetical protein
MLTNISTKNNFYVFYFEWKWFLLKVYVLYKFLANSETAINETNK